MNPLFAQKPCTALDDVPSQFCRTLLQAIGKLRTRLRAKYAHLFHGRAESLNRLLAEAEELAWQTPFPHLFLPTLAEERVAEFAAAPVLARAA
jgi:hypothetical protein